MIRNSLEAEATRQCGGRESNPRPVYCKSSALTTTLPSRIAITYLIIVTKFDGKVAQEPRKRPLEGGNTDHVKLGLDLWLELGLGWGTATLRVGG